MELQALQELLAATQRAFVKEKERADALAAAISERIGDDDLADVIRACVRLVSNRQSACGWQIEGFVEASSAITTAGYRKQQPTPPAEVTE